MVPCDFVRNGITVLKIIKLYFEKFSETIQNELLADKKKKKSVLWFLKNVTLKWDKLLGRLFGEVMMNKEVLLLLVVFKYDNISTTEITYPLLKILV